MKPFQSREQAGHCLADRLSGFKGKSDEVTVVGISDGGMIVAQALAERLELPLDVIVTQKIAVPSEPSLFLGAVSERGKGQSDSELFRLHGLDENEEKRMEAEAEVAVLRKAARLRQGCRCENLKGKLVILVDDGILSGFTMAAAMETARQRGATGVIVAAPVGQTSSLMSISDQVEDLIVPHQLTVVLPLSEYYESFPEEVAEADVIHALQVVHKHEDRRHQALDKPSKKVSLKV